MFNATAAQSRATGLMTGDAKHVMLVGGSRSGKTFVALRALIIRATLAPKSRHVVLRFRFNHVKSSVILDTFPKVMSLCFPQLTYTLDKTDWYATLPNGSQIWFGGLDDKDRTEKILGQEYATIFFNECSQIPLSARNMAVTRLAQNCVATVGGQQRQMRLKAFYDCNPPSMAHWTYKMFVKKIEPESGKALADLLNFSMMTINPRDNVENLPPDYIKELENLPARMRLRFLEGRFADVAAGALWNVEMIDTYRETTNLPDMLRVVVSVDPSGSGDTDNAGNDEIGIVVAGLGIDGRAYVLEDCTMKAGPSVWANVVATAYDRHAADLVVAEKNYGGEMVRHVIKSANPHLKCELINASRGKAVRAEPVSALTEQGKIRFGGTFPELEDELCSMTTNGYMGERSPNRADAFVWAMTKLFPGIIKTDAKSQRKHVMPTQNINRGATSWMGA